MNLFLWGACAAASGTVAIFFLRFWVQGRDRLFLYFALAFAVFALHWLGLGIVQPPEESRHYLYVLRLLAFLMIIAGIVDKNRATRRAPARR